MRMSDWSSDVCSSDLANGGAAVGVHREIPGEVGGLVGAIGKDNARRAAAATIDRQWTSGRESHRPAGIGQLRSGCADSGYVQPDLQHSLARSVRKNDTRRRNSHSEYGERIAARPGLITPRTRARYTSARSPSAVHHTESA